MWWILLDPIVYTTIIGYVIGSNVHGKHGSDKRNLVPAFHSDKVSATIDTAFAKAGFDDDEAEAFRAGYHVGVDEFDDKDDESRKMLSVVLSKAIDAADVEKIDGTLDILGDKLDGLFPRDVDTTDGSKADVKDLPSVTEIMATLVANDRNPTTSEKNRRKHAGKHDDHGKTAALDVKTDSDGHGPDNTLAKRWTPVEGIGKAMTEVMKGGVFEDLGDFLGSNTVHIDHPERAHSHEKRKFIRKPLSLETCECEHLLKAIVEPKPKPLNWKWWNEWKTRNFDGHLPDPYCMRICVDSSMDKFIKDVLWFDFGHAIPKPDGTDNPPLPVSPPPDNPPQKRSEAIDHAGPEPDDSKLMVDPDEPEDDVQKQKLVELYELLKAKGLKPATRRPVTVEDVRAAMIAVSKANSTTASIGKVDPKLEFLAKMKAMGLLRRPTGNRAWTFKDFIQLLKDRKAQDDALRNKNPVVLPSNADAHEGERETVTVIEEQGPHSKRSVPEIPGCDCKATIDAVKDPKPPMLTYQWFNDWDHKDVNTSCIHPCVNKALDELTEALHWYQHELAQETPPKSNAPQVPGSRPHLSKREEPTEHSAPAVAKMPIVQNEPPKSIFGGTYRDWYKKTQKNGDLCTCDLKAPSVWEWIMQIKKSKRCSKFCQQSVAPWLEKEKGLQAVPNEPSPNSTTTAESFEETSPVLEDTTGTDAPPTEPLETIDTPEVPSSGQGQETPGVVSVPLSQEPRIRKLPGYEPLPRPNEKPDLVHAPGLVNDIESKTSGATASQEA